MINKLNLETWFELCIASSADPEVKAGIWQDIHARYTDSRRHYHNLVHIRYMWDELLRIEDLAENPRALKFATILHDVTEEPLDKCSVAKSVAYAREALEAKLGLSTTFCQIVGSLVQATDHFAVEPKTLDEKIICDLDLLSLSKPYEEFMADGNRIWREYSRLVTAEEFRKWRANIVKNFLDRPQIYRTPFFADREDLAQDNLRRALADLS